MRVFPNARRVRLWLSALLVLAALPFVSYWIWSPGVHVTDGSNDQGTNGIWMSHRWLGDDAWFKANKREHLINQYRDPAYIESTLKSLSEKGLTDLFPHLAPTDTRGRLPAVDQDQTERVLDAAGRHGQRVMPWIGGVFELHCHPADPRWRETFIESVVELLDQHPRLAGVHLNIEPWPSGNQDCLLLLEELKREMREGKILSIAAYPPPTRWQPVPEVHWDQTYFREVASRCDQLAVMMYDTAIPLGKAYTSLMARWTTQVLDWSEGTPVLLGLPCYDDAEADYHDPAVENLPNALRGIHSGLEQRGTKTNYQGVALYSLWEMTDEQWDAYESGFRGVEPE